MCFRAAVFGTGEKGGLPNAWRRFVRQEERNGFLRPANQINGDTAGERIAFPMRSVRNGYKKGKQDGSFTA